MERFTVTANIHKPTATFHSTAPISFPIAHPRKDQSPIFSSDLHSNNAMPVSIGVSTELSIFTAERYFNDYNNNNNNAATKRVVAERSDLYTTDSSVLSMDGYGYGTNCRNEASVQFHVTPTSSSLASWNSQSGLLANPPGSASVTFRALPHAEQRKASSSSAFKWLFGWSCPCSGKRSVEVEERFQGPNKTPNHSNCDSGADGSSGVLKKQSNATIVASENNKPVLAEKTNLKLISTAPHDFQTAKTNLYSPETHYPSRIGHGVVTSGVPFADTAGFSFPILTKPTLDADPPRDSLEVFLPKDDTTNMPKSGEFDRRKPPADTTCWNFAFPGSPRVVADDDVLSDSSSDLFEIESFSTQMTSGTAYRRRDSLDEILAMDPRRFIESAAGILQLRQGVEEPTRPSNVPSECYLPSKVSVTTAEGFDRGSAANFSNAASEYEEAVAFVPLPEKNGSGGGGGKKRGGVLSCRCEKAVSVHGPLPVRHVAEQRKVAENGGGGARSSERQPPARSHSVRLTRPIQTRRSTCGVVDDSHA